MWQTNVCWAFVHGYSVDSPGVRGRRVWNQEGAYKRGDVRTCSSYKAFRMTRELKYLGEIQGLILMLLYETGTKSSIHKLNSLDKTVYADMVERMHRMNDELLIEFVNPEYRSHLEKRKRELEKSIGQELTAELEERFFTTEREEEYEKLKANPPLTKFQSINGYQIIESLLERINKVIDKNPKYQLDKEITYGTTTTYNFNAVAVRLDKSSNPLIILENEVFKTCHYLSKIVALSIPFNNQGPVYLEQPIKEEIKNI